MSYQRPTTKTLTQKDAQQILEDMPDDAEVYFEGKYFKSNEYKTGILAWSKILNKWILWLHEKPQNPLTRSDLEKIS